MLFKALDESGVGEGFRGRGQDGGTQGVEVCVGDGSTCDLAMVGMSGVLLIPDFIKKSSIWFVNLRGETEEIGITRESEGSGDRGEDLQGKSGVVQSGDRSGGPGECGHCCHTEAVALACCGQEFH